MLLPDAPALNSRIRVLATAAVVMLTVGMLLGPHATHGLRNGYGDTDDATRIVLVRELVNGRGWWDQHWMRLQPPVGVYMHWSRLLDGGLALMEQAFGLFTSRDFAETLTRFFWPLLWVFPIATGALLTARRLAEDTPAAKGAVPACAVLLVVNLQLYLQFHPGRVDHHDVQMTCFMLALAGALQRGPRVWGAVLAGVATGLGVAVGLEALVFEAAIGAALALRFAVDDARRRTLEAYGLALAATTVLAFAIQTPPWRWGAPACDAMAFNLVAAMAAGGLAVAVAARFAAGRGTALKSAILAAAGAATVALYLGLDPHCLKGPFADVDPRLRPLWLDHVQEVRSVSKLWRVSADEALGLCAGPLMGLIAWLWLGRRRSARAHSPWRLTGGVLLLSCAAGFGAVRMSGYAEWIATPLVAVAVAGLARRYARLGFVALLALPLIFNPASAGGLAQKANDALAKMRDPRPKPKDPPDFCFNAFAYRPLAAAGPPGVVLGEIDLGPFVLAHTADSALSAPYHRMSWGILTAHRVLSADADDGGAERLARGLHVAYVLDCPLHRRHADREHLTASSLQYELDHDDWPDWLERVSADKAPLRVFKVLPPAAQPAPPPTRAASASTAAEAASKT